MTVNMDYERKTAEVWLTHADEESPNHKEKLQALFEECKKEKIFVCVYHSGNGDLFHHTKALIRNNCNDVCMA